MIHIPQPVIISDILAKVVEKTAVAYGSAIQFMHEPEEQAEARLLEMTKEQAYDPTVKKYPLILVFHDYPERLGNSGGYYGEVTFPKIIICTMTEAVYTSEKRYDMTFKPILYPIYEIFKKMLCQSGMIVESDPKNLVCTKWDRLYWGTKGAGKALTDYLDAIELQNLKLTFQQNC